MKDDVMIHVDAAEAERKAARRDVQRMIMREGGAPYPFEAQRRAVQNALLVLGWDTTAAEVADAERDADLEAIAIGLSLAATRDTNTPAHRDRARAAMIQTMALGALVAARPKGKVAP